MTFVSGSSKMSPSRRMGKEKDGKKPKWGKVAEQTKSVKTIWAQWESLEVKDGILFRQWSSQHGTKHCIQQLVAPRHLQRELLRQCHNNRLGGHFVVRKTLANIRRGFYWPGYSADVERWCQGCWVCQRRTKGPTQRRAKLRWHKKRRHRMNRRRDCTKGTPKRARGPPPAKDVFRATPDILLIRESMSYTQMGPHGRKKQGERKLSPKVQEGKTTPRSMPQPQRDSAIRASTKLQPLSDCQGPDYNSLLR